MAVPRPLRAVVAISSFLFQVSPPFAHITFFFFLSSLVSVCHNLIFASRKRISLESMGDCLQIIPTESHEVKSMGDCLRTLPTELYQVTRMITFLWLVARARHSRLRSCALCDPQVFHDYYIFARVSTSGLPFRHVPTCCRWLGHASGRFRAVVASLVLSAERVLAP